MRSKGKALRIVIWVIIGLAVGLGGFIGLASYAYWELMGPLVYVSRSEGHGWEAALLWHDALQARTITLVVVPDASEDANFVVVGDVGHNDRSPYFREACWSGDGTVVAVRGEVSGKVDFTHAYDFVENEVIAPAKFLAGEDLDSLMERAEKIEKLVAERGGEGRIIASGETIWDLQKKKIWWREWRRWERILEECNSKRGLE